MVAKKPKVKKAKKAKKGKKVQKKGKKRTNFISNDSFDMKELDRYVKVLQKIRKGKKTQKAKKVGLTNTVSFLNLLFNADKEKQKNLGARQNLMKANAHKYPSLIQNADLGSIWNATKLSKSKNRTGLVHNLNNAYRQLLAYDLIHAPRNNAPATPAMVGGKEKNAPAMHRDDDVVEVHKVDDSDSDDDDDE